MRRSLTLGEHGDDICVGLNKPFQKRRKSIQIVLISNLLGACRNGLERVVIQFVDPFDIRVGADNKRQLLSSLDKSCQSNR